MDQEFDAFVNLTLEQKGKADPGVEIVSGADEIVQCRFLDLSVSPDDEPMLGDGEEFLSCWEAEGAIVYDLGSGNAEPACGGTMLVGIAADRLVGSCFNGSQFIDESLNDVESEASVVMFSWSFETINQVIVEMNEEGSSDLEVVGVRLVGGQRGDMISFTSIAPTAEDWYSIEPAPDGGESALLLAQSLAQALARFELKRDPIDAEKLRRIAAGLSGDWEFADSPYTGSSRVRVLGFR